MINRDDPIILPDVLRYLELNADTPWDIDMVRAEIKQWEKGEDINPLCEQAIEYASDRFSSIWNG